jgi:hypothetical protein
VSNSVDDTKRERERAVESLTDHNVDRAIDIATNRAEWNSNALERQKGMGEEKREEREKQ